MDWYPLMVISGKEKKIKEAILSEVSNASLGEEIKDILVPTENIVEMRDGKKKVKEKVFFPGYMLVNIEMNKNTRFLLENIKNQLWPNITYDLNYLSNLNRNLLIKYQIDPRRVH